MKTKQAQPQASWYLAVLTPLVGTLQLGISYYFPGTNEIYYFLGALALLVVTRSAREAAQGAKVAYFSLVIFFSAASFYFLLAASYIRFNNAGVPYVLGEVAMVGMVLSDFVVGRKKSAVAGTVSTIFLACTLTFFFSALLLAIN